MHRKKYYFIDNGIRNAIISNYNSIDMCSDKGSLWENFFVKEKLKKAEHDRIMPIKFRFWRTHDGQEIDLIEMINDNIMAYEIKYQNKKAKIPKQWANNYPNSKFITVAVDNFAELLL